MSWMSEKKKKKICVTQHNGESGKQMERGYKKMAKIHFCSSESKKKSRSGATYMVKKAQSMIRFEGVERAGGNTTKWISISIIWPRLYEILIGQLYACIRMLQEKKNPNFVCMMKWCISQYIPLRFHNRKQIKEREQVKTCLTQSRISSWAN